jgi:hypothetical protein
MNPANPLAPELVILAPNNPIRGQAAAGIQLIETSPRSGSIPKLCPLRELFFLLDSRLMELLAIRLGWQTAPAKSLVMHGNDGANELFGMNTLLRFSDSTLAQGPRP